jgi:amidophosphoribosyltransferase
VFGCRYLNFSRSRSELDLAGRRAVAALGAGTNGDIVRYTDHETIEYAAMVSFIREGLGLTTLRYQTLPHMVEAIGLPRERLCTYCWTGEASESAGRTESRAARTVRAGAVPA